MRLTHLILSNIGPFRGSHIIDLTTEKKCTGFAFFAANGRGKTSLYNAMRWCLWGEVRSRVRATAGKRISGSLRPIVGDYEDILMNQEAYLNDRYQEMEVILLAEDEKGRIQVTRNAKSTTTFPRSDEEIKITLTVESAFGTNKGEKAQEEIEKIFPRELERFFFIDGEALEEYTDMLEQDSIRGIKEEVEAVLRLPALTRGRDDLDSIKKEIGKRIKSNIKKEKTADKASKKVRKLNNDLRLCSGEVNNLKNQIESVEIELEKINLLLEKNAEMNVYVEQLKDKRTELKYAEGSLKEYSQERLNQSKEAWKVLIWEKAGPIYDELNKKVDSANQRSYEIKEIIKRIDLRKQDLKEMNEICSECGQEIPDINSHLKIIEEKIKQDEKHLEKLHNIDDDTAQQLQIKLGRLAQLMPQRGDKKRIIDRNEKWFGMRKNILTLKEKISKLDDRVTSEAQAKLGKLGDKKFELGEKFGQLRIQLFNAQQDEAFLKSELRPLESKAKGSGINQEENIHLLITKLMKVLDNTIDDYREIARNDVEKYATEIFLEVTNAKDVMKEIKLDNNFRASIILRSGRIAKAPSSGMKSMMTISIIDALRRVSGLEAPIFFDTPGRSLDEDHKQAMLEYFWRDHGQQFLIFAHSGEFEVEPTLKKFSDKIAKAWELTWPGDHEECQKCGSEHTIYSKSKRINQCLEEDCKHETDTSVEHTMIKELIV
jgi:DNA sulfur modification protein DndD